MANRMEKILRDTEDGVYQKGQKVLLSEEEAKQREVAGEAMPIGGWMDEKDMGETKTDNEVGAGYGPFAVAARNSNVARSFTADELEADGVSGEPGFEPDDAAAGPSADSDPSAGSGAKSSGSKK